MGGKKSKSTKPRKTPIPKLETRFDCPICNHEKVIQCKIIKGEGRGHMFCTVCEAQFKCNVSALDKPIDVYHAWSDSIDEKK